jgi:hypothetical protein
MGHGAKFRNLPTPAIRLRRIADLISIFFEKQKTPVIGSIKVVNDWCFHMSA